MVEPYPGVLPVLPGGTKPLGALRIEDDLVAFVGSSHRLLTDALWPALRGSGASFTSRRVAQCRAVKPHLEPHLNPALRLGMNPQLLQRPIIDGEKGGLGFDLAEAMTSGHSNPSARRSKTRSRSPRCCTGAKAGSD